MQQSEIREKCVEYTLKMESIIRQNSLKYKGLNVFAKEFIPSKTIHIKTTEEMENELFDNLEMEFVRKNPYFFE
jgi:hypothetical protein